MILKLHNFGEYQKAVIPPRLRTPSDWMPRYFSDIQLNAASKFNDIYTDLFRIKFSAFKAHDPIVKELKNLLNRADIKIVQSDKNLGITIMNTMDYHNLVIQHLKLSKVYNNVCKTDNAYFIKLIENSIETEFEGIVPIFVGYELEFINYCGLKPRSYFSVFHGMPKLHKNKPIAELPLRPIIANRPEQLQSRVSIVLTERLLTKLKEFDKIILNSTSLKNDIENLDANNSILVSIDFESLYTSIPLTDLYNLIDTYDKWSVKFRRQTISAL